MEAYRDELGIVTIVLSNQTLQIGPLKIHTSLEKRLKSDEAAITAAEGVRVTAEAPGGRKSVV